MGKVSRLGSGPSGRQNDLDLLSQRASLRGQQGGPGDVALGYRLQVFGSCRLERKHERPLVLGTVRGMNVSMALGLTGTTGGWSRASTEQTG